MFSTQDIAQKMVLLLQAVTNSSIIFVARERGNYVYLFYCEGHREVTTARRRREKMNTYNVVSSRLMFVFGLFVVHEGIQQ